MGKGCSGIAMFLILVLVVAVVGYDQWRIEQLRNEVASISGKIHVGNAPKGAPAGESDLVTALAQAERYTKQAQELLKSKKTAQAQVELQKAMKSLKSANNVSKDIIGDTAQFLGNARNNAVKVFQKAWNDISEEAKPSKK